MKSREHVTTNGRAAFYASMWEDLRKEATNCGWALGLHGSLNSDMDIMAMPWTEDAVEPMELMKKLEDLFTKPDALCHGIEISKDKPNGRIVYTIHIWADFYLDINVISAQPREEERNRAGTIPFYFSTIPGGHPITTSGASPEFRTVEDLFKNVIVSGKKMPYEIVMHHFHKKDLFPTQEEADCAVDAMIDFYQQFQPREMPERKEVMDKSQEMGLAQYGEPCTNKVDYQVGFLACFDWLLDEIKKQINH